ncbi:MAG: multidrug effflux MFS transporter [Proteobacteria bacterium]|nr:multidrug effflux MFS transporter [Pseudomonadota bacterium]
MHQHSSSSDIGFTEFVVLIALIISLVALSIDAMLPALPEIAADLMFEDANDAQYIITMLFIGMGIGQIIFGPLSDSIGRKPAINLGFVVFILGCLMSIIAQDFNDMMIGRFLQGLGAAGPRIVSIALVRDRFAGRQMARVMSFVMTIFILIPIIAPSIGQLIVNYSTWHSIFVLFLVLTIVAMTWFSLRQPETLPREKRISFSPAQMMSDIKSICAIPAAMGYTITMGFIFGAFIGYLSSAQQILQTQYALGNQFAIYFGVLAASIGLASLVNAKLVMRFGMRRLSRAAMTVTALLSVPFFLLAQYYQGHPPLAQLMAYLLCVFFFFGIMFGNLNALAMEPLGHIAGLGSALVGSVSTLMSVMLGIIVAGAYDGTILPLVASFAILSFLGLVTMHWTEKMSNAALAS